MRIEFDIPETHAASVAQLAAEQGLTPTQWVINLIKVSLRPPQLPQHGRPAVNTERDRMIAARRKAGTTAAALAKEFGVSEIRIHQICRSYRHV
jgi:uncharacterized protein YecA (UPF0149 family)